MYPSQNDKNIESRWLTGEISTEEFLNRSDRVKPDSDLERATAIIQAFEVPAKKSAAQVWAEIENCISERESVKVVPLYRQYWMGVAASLVLAIGAFFILNQTYNNQITITTSLAEMQTVYLPDSSVVYLNADSEISFSKEEWRAQRTIDLTGEAFFEVKSGNIFTVQTSLGKVIVLGTSFNMRERNEILEVACKSGRVKVMFNNTDDFAFVAQGEAVTIKKDEVPVQTQVELTYIDNWRTGGFDFESVMLTQVFEEIERQYDVELDYNEGDIQDRPYTGYFDNKNLNEALQLVCYAMGLDFKIENRKVIIMSKGAATQLC